MQVSGGDCFARMQRPPGCVGCCFWGVAAVDGLMFRVRFWASWVGFGPLLFRAWPIWCIGFAPLVFGLCPFGVSSNISLDPRCTLIKFNKKNSD